MRWVLSSDPSLGTIAKAKHGGGGCEAGGDLVSGLVCVQYLLLVVMGGGIRFWDCRLSVKIHSWGGGGNIGFIIILSMRE